MADLPTGQRPSTGHRREILALAVPALGALVAQPLFLLADSAIVGRLGTVPLAGLGLAGAILWTVVGLFVFLAYATTASVARRLGADDHVGALSDGIDGMWLAAVLGTGAAVLTMATRSAVLSAFSASGEVVEQAHAYLTWALPGLPGMFLVLAATGALRGLQDTRTPLYVAVTGAVVNTVLNVILVFGMHLGIAGSAIGTSLTEWGMAATLGVIVLRGARRLGAPVRPHPDGILRSARTGTPLLIRTVSLRAALLLTTYAATAQGTAALAAHQVAFLVWSLLSLVQDALAIAAQALTGKALGSGDADAARTMTREMVRWGLGAGVVLAAVVLLADPLVGPAFSTDPAVRHTLAAALVIVALAQPLAGYVFVLDGVLIGAGDGRFLALAGVLQLLPYSVLTLAVTGITPGGTTGLVWLWIAFAGGYMALRAVFLGLRERSGAYLVTGATR
jgi:putative MATE family efflux protein